MPDHQIDPAGCDRFARLWATAVVGSSYLPLSGVETESLLREFTEVLARALGAEPFDPGAGANVGAALVEANFTNATSLGRTIGVLPELVSTVAPRLADTTAGDRVVALQASLAKGYAQAQWLRTLAEQEQIRSAVLEAMADAQDALRASEARFRAIFAGAGIGISVSDADGTVIEVNQVMADMMGRSVAELTGVKLSTILDGDDLAIRDGLLNGGRDHIRFEKRYERPDGRPVWVDMTVSLIRDATDLPRYTVAMARDVTDRHVLADRLHHEATHDPLTRLPNRALFFTWLERAFAEARREDRVGVCYLDLDGFKVVNDTLGHDAGDEMLAAVAARLQSTVSRLGHRIARVGGDEFALLVTRSAGVDEVTGLADAVLEALKAPVQLAGHRLSVSASIGIVERPVRGTTTAELMKAADLTLYWAKAEGKARWVLFNHERNDELMSRYALSAALPAALERGEFFLEYQPLIRLGDSAVIGAEALLRWRHPRLGVLAPERFVHFAEETGLIVPLGSWVLREACQQAVRWQGVRENVFVSVNLAARQANTRGIVDDVALILADVGLDPALLQLELTESAAMGTTAEQLESLECLADKGVRIAIDDFGTGYSNLAYLRRLPVHCLKLAGSFLEGLSTEEPDPVDRRIVASLIDMAHALGLTVTAEGVEVAAQAERLRNLGCDSAQGFYFARPGPSAAMTDLLLGGPPVVRLLGGP